MPHNIFQYQALCFINPFCSAGFEFLEISFEMSRYINHFVSDFGDFVLVGWLKSRRGFQESWHRRGKQWFRFTYCQNFRLFIAKSQTDLLKVLEFKQFVTRVLLQLFISVKKTSVIWKSSYYQFNWNLSLRVIRKGLIYVTEKVQPNFPACVL